MVVKPSLFLAVAASLVLATGHAGPRPEVAADTLYLGGDIITIDDAQLTVEAPESTEG
jgi:hypothetical protein